jgi:hypothetical protein
MNTRLVRDNPLWKLIVESEEYTKLRRATIQVMLTESDHEAVLIDKQYADGEIDRESYNERIVALREQRAILTTTLADLQGEMVKSSQAGAHEPTEGAL